MSKPFANSGRDPYWDCVKGALMVLVVLGHFVQLYLVNASGGGTPLLESLLCLIYFFHMPLFVFVSGMFSKSLAKRRERSFDELIVPFLVCQFLWLVVTAVVDGPRVAASLLLVPQFTLWYLVALFAWRMLLPDLSRVRFILPIAAALFFVGQFFGCLDNTFAAQRTIGFFFFFLLGYRLDAGRAVASVRKVPLAVAIALFIGTLAALFAEFSNGLIPYDKVISVLTHGGHIDGTTGYLFGMGAYAVAFVGAVVLSVCFLRVTLSLKSLGAISAIGTDTMPLYLAHGYVVKAFCAALVPIMPELPEVLLLGLLVLLTLGVVAVFSTVGWRRVYSRAISSCEKILLRPMDYVKK